jgi:RNA-binding protein
MPSGKLRSSLRGHGHRLSPIVLVGKAGVTPGLVKQVGQALADHELIKLKVAAEGPADRFAVADQLAALPGVNVVQIVGGSILLYKRHPRVARYEGKLAREPGVVDEARGEARTSSGPKAKSKVGAGAGVKPRPRSAGKGRPPSRAKGAPRADRRSR